MIQVRSNRMGHAETTLVFMRGEKADVRLLVTAIEPREATVVELKVNPTALRRWLDHPSREMSSVQNVNDDSEP